MRAPLTTGRTDERRGPDARHLGSAMASKRKLFLKALNNPAGLRFAEFATLIEAFGFAFRRQRGSHRIYSRADVGERVNFQSWSDGKAKVAQVQEFLKMVDRRGLSLEEDEP